MWLYLLLKAAWASLSPSALCELRIRSFHQVNSQDGSPLIPPDYISLGFSASEDLLNIFTYYGMILKYIVMLHQLF